MRPTFSPAKGKVSTMESAGKSSTLGKTEEEQRGRGEEPFSGETNPHRGRGQGTVKAAWNEERDTNSACVKDPLACSSVPVSSHWKPTVHLGCRLALQLKGPVLGSTRTKSLLPCSQVLIAKHQENAAAIRSQRNWQSGGE